MKAHVLRIIKEIKTICGLYLQRKIDVARLQNVMNGLASSLEVNDDASKKISNALYNFVEELEYIQFMCNEYEYFEKVADEITSLNLLLDKTEKIDISNTKEIWHKWVPLDGTATRYVVTNIEQNSKIGLRIQLSMEHDFKETLEIQFSEAVLAYRYTEESILQFTIHFLETRYGKEFYSTWNFFKIDDSEYLEWFSKESYGCYATLNLTHFCIMTSDERIDIIATCEPVVRKHSIV